MKLSRVGATGLALAAGFASVFSTPVALAAEVPAAVVQSQRGLHTVSFNTLQGAVRVLLPDDMAPGDTISGSIVLDPAGSNNVEREANSAILRTTVIDLGGKKMGVGTALFTMSVPTAVTETLPIAFVAGRRAASTIVPLSNPAAVARAAARSAATPGRFDWPPTVSTGSPATIAGPFDGDASNTSLSLGEEAVPIIAESPRQAVMQLPGNAVAGLSQLSVQDGPRLTQGSMRIVSLGLSAPKTDLVRGEKTLLSIQVTGLQDLQHAVPMQLNTNGRVTTDGGNRQQILIPSNDPSVVASGVFRLNRTITGTGAGGFEVVAEIVWAQPAPWLAGKIVHVEGSPSGHAGRWRVPIKFARDSTEYPVYFGGEKKPDLRVRNWIEVGEAEVRDGVDYVKDYKRTTAPAKSVPPPAKPLPPAKTTP